MALRSPATAARISREIQREKMLLALLKQLSAEEEDAIWGAYQHVSLGEMTREQALKIFESVRWLLNELVVLHKVRPTPVFYVY